MIKRDSQRTIEISNIGPIEHLTIPVPEGGGLCVLRARNGKGKSKALDALENALSGNGKMEVRDGALKGSVDAFGVTLTVGRSTRRKGELEVEHLSGRYNIEHLVDPGLKSPEAADAARIKALIQIAGIEPDPSRFHDLVGGREQFERIVGPNAIASGDPVTMADRIKRDLESAARKHEQQADNAEGRATGARQAAEGIDTTGPFDAKALQVSLETAIKIHSGLLATAKAADEWKRSVQAAKDCLEDAEAGFGGLSLEQADEGLRAAQEEIGTADEVVIEAERRLASAKHRRAEAELSLTHAQQAVRQAQQHEKMVAEWRKQVTAPAPQFARLADVQIAEQNVVRAREAVEQGALVRRALQSLEEAQQAVSEASEHRKAADQLREAAKATDEVLSSLVAEAGLPLRVEAGRLVTQTKRGATYFADLSAGERRKLAIDGAIKKVGQHGVIPICQEAYESLDPIARQELADHLRERGVVGITAECSADEQIVAEVHA